MTTKPSPTTFAAALIKNIGSLMSGALSVVFAAIGLYVNAKFAHDAFFAFAGVCAMIAMYRVWSNERTERLRAESYLVGPDLRIQLHRCHRWSGGGGPYLLLELTVTNHSVGTATVERFDCFLFQPDGVQVKDGGWTTVDQFNRFIVRDAATGVESPMNEETPDLAIILAESPLPRAQHIHGYLELYFPTLPLKTGEVDLELRVRDALGGLHCERRSVPFVVDAWFGMQASQEFKARRN